CRTVRAFGEVVPAGPVSVTVVKVDRSCAQSPSASGSSASLNGCAKLIRCSRAAEPTYAPDQASTALPDRDRAKPTAPSSQQPKLAIARLASLASIHAASHAAATAAASPQVITTTIADISSSATVATLKVGDPRVTINLDFPYYSRTEDVRTEAGSSSLQGTAGPAEYSEPVASGSNTQRAATATASANASTSEPSTSTAVAAPRRICTLKVKIFLIKHLSKLVACNKKMFLPVKSNTIHHLVLLSVSFLRHFNACQHRKVV
uniref:Uncharacterized protein n=2 Tax=Anopheles atroparvus TaxID=41427 RepID=A0AAG5DQJ2_ANOAO